MNNKGSQCPNHPVSPESYLNDILENSIDVLFRYNFKTNQYEYLSKSVEAFTGYSRSDHLELRDRYFHEHLHPEDLQKFTDLMQQMAGSTLRENRISLDYRLRQKNGRYRWVCQNLNIIRDKDSLIEAVVGNVRDITEQKEAEQALAESERQYRVMFDEATIGIIVGDLDTSRPQYVNAALCKMLGYTKEELLQLTAPDLHPAESLPILWDLFEKNKKGCCATMEIPCIRKDSSIIHVLANGSFIHLNGKLHGIGFFADITEQKKFQDEVKAAQERFKRLADATFEGIAIYDGPIIREVNQQFADMFGYTMDELKDLDGLKLAPPESHPLIREYLRNKGSDPAGGYALRKDGTIFPIEIRSREIMMDGKQLRIAAVRDLSVRFRLEQEVQTGERKYRRLYNNAQIPLYRTRISDGRILECNLAFARLCGYDSVDECLNRFYSTDHYLNPIQRKKFLDLLNNKKRSKTWS